MKNNKTMQMIKEKVNEINMVNNIGSAGLDDNFLYEIINNHILHNDEKLLFLCKTGSYLYGMNNQNSDLDIKGIFMPSKKSLILQQKVNQYGTYSTTNKNNKSNSKDDVDIELWSIHKFFKLLQKGDTNAYDILGAMSNKKCVIYSSEEFKNIYRNRNTLMGAKPITKSFIGFSYGQFKRYELKGLNFSTLKSILLYFKELDWETTEKVSKYLDDFVGFVKMDSYTDAVEGDYDKYIKVEEFSDGDYIVINESKRFPVGIRIKDFVDTIQKWTNIYGSRVKKNEDGIDYKSISHAFRVLEEARQLAEEGDLTFPLEKSKRKRFLNIKQGKEDYKKLVEELETYIDVVDKLLHDTDKISLKPNAKIMKKIILDLYS